MMSTFFHFQFILNRLFNNCIVILILDKFFLKYEGGSQNDPPHEKLPSKSPALLGLRISLKNLAALNDIAVFDSNFDSNLIQVWFDTFLETYSKADTRTPKTRTPERKISQTKTPKTEYLKSRSF